MVFFVAEKKLPVPVGKNVMYLAWGKSATDIQIWDLDRTFFKYNFEYIFLICAKNNNYLQWKSTQN